MSGYFYCILKEYSFRSYSCNDYTSIERQLEKDVAFTVVDMLSSPGMRWHLLVWIIIKWSMLITVYYKIICWIVAKLRTACKNEHPSIFPQLYQTKSMTCIRAIPFEKLVGGVWHAGKKMPQGGPRMVPISEGCDNLSFRFSLEGG